MLFGTAIAQGGSSPPFAFASLDEAVNCHAKEQACTDIYCPRCQLAPELLLQYCVRAFSSPSVGSSGRQGGDVDPTLHCFHDDNL
jgi:hypothetical protein